MKILISIFFLSINFVLFAQSTKEGINVIEIEKDNNVRIEKIYSDSSSSYFVIWIKDEIKLHKHQDHSEKLLVLEGAGKMVVGKKSFKVKVGEHFVIPKNTMHSIQATSKKPIKFIAIRYTEDHVKH